MACRGSGVRVSLAPFLEPSLRLGFLMFCCRQCSRPVHPTAPRRLRVAHVQPWKLGSSGLRPSACASPSGRAILTTVGQLDIKRWQATCSRKTRGLLAGTRGGGPVREGAGGVPDQHPARSQQLSEGPAQQRLPTGWRHVDAALSRAVLQGLPRRRHGPWAQPVNVARLPSDRGTNPLSTTAHRFPTSLRCSSAAEATAHQAIPFTKQPSLRHLHLACQPISRQRHNQAYISTTGADEEMARP